MADLFFFSLPNSDRKVIVVSVIGKSQYRAKGCKTEMLSTVLLAGLLDDPTVDENTLVNSHAVQSGINVHYLLEMLAFFLSLIIAV